MKYIDAEKLIAEIESIRLIPQISADYNDGREDMKNMVLDLITSLHQEQPSLPSDLNDAAFDYAELCKYDGVDKLLCAEHFKDGARWMAVQGTRKEE